MVGAIITDWCDEPGKLICEKAKHFKAKYIVTGKSNRVKLATAHSVSGYVYKNRHEPCSVLSYKILKGWKSGEPTKPASGHSDSPEPKPTSQSPRRQMLTESPRGHMLSETSKSNRRPLPLAPSEAVASTRLLTSQRTQPPEMLSLRSAPDADSKRWQFPPPPQKLASAEVSTIRLCSSEAEQYERTDFPFAAPTTSQLDSVEAAFVFWKSHFEPSGMQWVSPRSHLEPKKIDSAIAQDPLDSLEELVHWISQLKLSGVLSVSSKSQLEPSKVESEIPQGPLDPVEGEFVAARSPLEPSQVPSVSQESQLELSQMLSMSPESQLEPSQMPSVSPESQLEQGKEESSI